MGANFWYGVNLAVEDPKRLLRELDTIKGHGITNLRILATSQGPDTEPWRMKPAIEYWDSKLGAPVLNETYLKGMDMLIDECGKRDIDVVIMFNDYWHWSGGFGQYVYWFTGKTGPIPYPANQTDKKGYDTYINFTSEFYVCDKCMEHFEEVAVKIINRKNTVNGLLYKNDPTIMAWQLANEPFPNFKGKEATKWIEKICSAIKKVDNNHMVSIGNTGNEEINYNDTLLIGCIDYCTFHVWAQNAEWYDPKHDNETYDYAVWRATEYIRKNVEGTHKILKELEKNNSAIKDKPLVLEEFGLARDKENFFPENSTFYKDKYYEFIFQNVTAYEEKKMTSGVNFWAWAGEGRPPRDHRTWQLGDQWIGDPPHENQGWYSVYNTDTTVNVIRKYADKLNRKYEITNHDLGLDFWLFITVPVVLVSVGIFLDWKLRGNNESPESLIVSTT